MLLHAAHTATPITEYGPVPSSLPVGGVCEVEFDHSGALWVEQYLSSQVARFDPATGQFANFSTPVPLSVPGGMTELPLPWANAFNAQSPGLPPHSVLGLANDLARGPEGAR